MNVSASELDAANATVLIDTWWNVNAEPKGFRAWADKVLIDTWWNVNVEPDPFSYGTSEF